MKNSIKTVLVLLIISLSVSCVALFTDTNVIAEEKVYDVSEVFPQVERGKEIELLPTVKVGDVKIEYGQKVKFQYKISSYSGNGASICRSAFGIGSYGFYLYGSTADIFIRTANLTNPDNYGRGSANLVKITPYTSFEDYSTITMWVVEKNASTVTLNFNYTTSSQDTVGTLFSYDFAKDGSSDGLFRVGDYNFRGNYVKSTLEEVKFGDERFTFTGSAVNGISYYGGSRLSVQEKSQLTGTELLKTESDVILKADSLSKSGLDVVIDYSKSNYRRRFVESITFRVYVVSTESDSVTPPSLRVHVENKWVYGVNDGNSTITTDSWQTITLTGSQIDDICVDGYLGSFSICLKTKEKTTVYIDEVSLKSIPTEQNPPVFDHIVENVSTTVGTYPLEFTAKDDTGNAYLTVTWSIDALDVFGRLNKGTHTCTIDAEDDFNNKAQLVVTYVVEDNPQLQLYTIIFKADGKEVDTVEYCEDEVDYLQLPSIPRKEGYKGSWESFTCEKTNNQVVNAVYVLGTTETYTITFDCADCQSITVNEGETAVLPVPQKQGYKFIGWYDGSVKFTNNTVVTKDVSLKAKFEEIKQEDSESSATPSSGCSSNVNGLYCIVLAIMSISFLMIKKGAKYNGRK